MPQRLGSRALQRAATEHSRGASSGTATEHSPARSRVLDPDIRLQKSRTTAAVRIKTHHPRTPDVGIVILIFMPGLKSPLSKRAFI